MVYTLILRLGMQAMKNKAKALCPEELHHLSSPAAGKKADSTSGSGCSAESSDPSQTQIICVTLPSLQGCGIKTAVAMETKAWNSVNGESVQMRQEHPRGSSPAHGSRHGWAQLSCPVASPALSRPLAIQVEVLHPWAHLLSSGLCFPYSGPNIPKASLQHIHVGHLLGNHRLQ